MSLWWCSICREMYGMPADGLCPTCRNAVEFVTGFKSAGGTMPRFDGVGVPLMPKEQPKWFPDVVEKAKNPPTVEELLVRIAKALEGIDEKIKVYLERG